MYNSHHPPVTTTFWLKIDYFSYFLNFNKTQTFFVRPNFGKNTKCIALLFGSKLANFGTFQISTKIKHFLSDQILVKIPSV